MDPFTGLGNLFSCLVDLEDRFNKPSANRTPDIYLGLVDIDGLSELNDTLGRHRGDEALMLVRTTLLDVLGPSGAHAYRFSLDEYAVTGVLADLKHLPDGAAEIVSVYHERARELFPEGVVPTISMGLVLADPTSSTMGSVLTAANAAIARAKSTGGNSLEVTDVRGGAGTTGGRDLLTLFAGRILQTLDIIADVGELALTDPLTGLPNQRAVQQNLKQRFASSVADSQVPETSILLVDGDRLREYNNQFGYSRGNQMIRDLVGILDRGKRKDDFLGRWFVGDEFMLILRETSIEAALRAAERLRASVELETSSWPLPVTISVGVASTPTHATTADRLLVLVQDACEAAKRRGKNQVVSASELGN